MENALKQLIRISNAVGGDTSLVQGVGGNTSVKTDDREFMYIKASGTALKDMTEKKGWRRLKIKKVLSIFADESLARMPVNKRELEMVNRLGYSCDDHIKTPARPSVESTLHVLLDKFVIHLHPLAVLAFACAENGKDKILNLFADAEPPPVWLPYANPGFSLGRKVLRSVSSYRKQYGKKPAVMFLQNHGLLVNADSPDKALQLLYNVIHRCNAALKKPAHTLIKPNPSQVNYTRQAIEKVLFEATGRNTPVEHFINRTISAFMTRPDAPKLLKAPPLAPDEAGFAASPVQWLEAPDERDLSEKLNSCISQSRSIPSAFLVKSLGLFIAAKAKMAPLVRDIVTGSLFIRANAQDVGGIHPLGKPQRDFIKNWEAENFRIELAGRQ